jgi:hypothetical protein
MLYDLMVIAAHPDDAEVFKSHSPLMVSDPTVFLPGLHA